MLTLILDGASKSPKSWFVHPIQSCSIFPPSCQDSDVSLVFSLSSHPCVEGANGPQMFWVWCSKINYWAIFLLPGKSSFPNIKGYFIFRQSNILANPHTQLANIFITVTAGSILDSLGEIVEHPGNMLAILGKSLPNVVGYFATFIMTKILAGLPLILLRFGPLIWLVFIKLCFREKYMTQAEIDEAYYPQMFSQVNCNNYGNCHALLFSFLTVFSSRSCAP